MWTKIIIGAAIIVYILFLLSVFGPLHSEKKFWIVIQKIRGIMDVGSYWFYNICVISVILYIVCMVIYSLSKQ